MEILHHLAGLKKNLEIKDIQKDGQRKIISQVGGISGTSGRKCKMEKEQLHKEIRDSLIKLSDILMDYYNPCEIYGSRCRVGDPNPCCKHTIFGEGVCPFLKETCTNPNVDCKLWFCETAINNMEPECIESFKALEQLARVHKLIRKPFLGQPYVGADKQPK